VLDRLFAGNMSGIGFGELPDWVCRGSAPRGEMDGAWSLEGHGGLETRCGVGFGRGSDVLEERGLCFFLGLEWIRFFDH
jgi:hypothetical protein